VYYRPRACIGNGEGTIMNILIDSSFAGSLIVGTNTQSFTVGNNTNRVLVIGVAEETIAYITSVKFNGVALTKIGDGGGTNRSASPWIIKNLPVGTYNIEIVTSLQSGGFWALSAYNVDQTVTVRGTQTAAMGYGGTYTMDITTVAGDLVLAAGTGWTGSGNYWLIPDVSQTVIGTHYGSPPSSVGSYLTATGTTTTISGTVHFGGPEYYGLFLSALIPYVPTGYANSVNGMSLPGYVNGMAGTNIKTVNGA